MKNAIKIFQTPVILLGGGDINWPIFQHYLDKGWPLVAADGAANALEATDIVPELIMGDLDSLKNLERWEEKTAVHKIAEQDTTDFEKCLYSIDAPHFIAFGFLGRRLDHTLATLHATAKYVGQKQILLIDESDAAIVTSDAVSLDIPIGCRISVFPLSQTLFASSTGLEYKLDGLVLAAGNRVGTSNRASANHVVITPETSNTGAYTVIVPVAEHEALLQPITGTVD